MLQAEFGAQDGGSTEGCARGADELRAAFFAHAGEHSTRYGVLFEQLAAHVREAEAIQPDDRPLVLRYFDDLVHIVACVHGVDVAWRDLQEQHERALVRTCRERLEADEAIVFVRRLFAQLRRQRRAPAGERGTSLRCYDGSCSLRRWLRDRLLESLDADAWWRGASTAPLRLPPVPAAPAVPAVGPVDGRILQGASARRRGARVEWPAYPGIGKRTGESG